MMKILIAGNFWRGSIESSYFSAFEKEGFNVFRWDMLGDYKKINQMPFIGKLLSGLSFNYLSRRLYEEVMNVKPDLLFVVKGYYILPEILMKIKQSLNLKIFNFNPDNPFNLKGAASNKNIIQSLPLFDCYFIWGKFLIPLLKEAGVKKTEYLSFGFDIDMHFPVEVSDSERKEFGSDVVFIGSWDKKREKFLEGLADFDLAIWGNGWHKVKLGSILKSKWKGRTAIGQDFAKVCSASKIVLNLLREQNQDAHNMRTFEVPACKGFLMTQRTQEQCDFFTDGKEIVTFESMPDLRQKIKYYITRESERSQIAQAGYVKVQKHTYLERVRQIIHVYESMK